jgi:3-oxoacyl-[acyl-carrier-protein] synthase III
MIGITAIGYVLGAERIDNAARNIAEPELLEQKIGVRQIARRGDEDTSDLAVAAVADLQQRHPFDAEKIECLIVVTHGCRGA